MPARESAERPTAVYGDFRVARADGSVEAWGLNDQGQLDVPAGEPFAAVAAGMSHNLALTPEPTSLWLLALPVARPIKQPPGDEPGPLPSPA